MLDIMVDLETLGTRPGCTVMSIGAVAFDPVSGFVDPDGFYQVINREYSAKIGLREEENTVSWWANQSDDAKQVLMDSSSLDCSRLPCCVLEDFKYYLSKQGDLNKIRVWGNGSDFDNAILTDVFYAAGVTAPWKFYNNRCYRTLKNLYPEVVFKRSGVHHNALDDARSQAEHAVEIFKHMRR